MKKSFLISLFILLPFYLFISSVSVKSMESDNYQLQDSSFEVINKINKPPVKDFDLKVLGETALDKFSFSVSDLAVNFGSLSPNKPVIKTINLAINPGNNNNYELIAFENHPLQITTGTTQIPDTFCNGEINICDEIKAGPWDDQTKPGFGFNISNNKSDNNYFRQFSDISNKEKPQIIWFSQSLYTEPKAKLTLKVNVSETQAVGNYENIIYLIGVPGY